MTMETQGSRVKDYECHRHNLKVVVAIKHPPEGTMWQQIYIW